VPSPVIYEQPIDAAAFSPAGVALDRIGDLGAWMASVLKSEICAIDVLSFLDDVAKSEM
jgi:hypothetical protein